MEEPAGSWVFARRWTRISRRGRRVYRWEDRIRGEEATVRDLYDKAKGRGSSSVLGLLRVDSKSRVREIVEMHQNLGGYVELECHYCRLKIFRPRASLGQQRHRCNKYRCQVENLKYTRSFQKRRFTTITEDGTRRKCSQCGRKKRILTKGGEETTKYFGKATHNGKRYWKSECKRCGSLAAREYRSMRKMGVNPRTRQEMAAAHAAA